MWLACCVLLCRNLLLKINYLPFLLFFFFSILYILRGGDYQNLKSTSELISILSGYLIIPLLFLFYNKYCSNKQKIWCVGLMFVAVLYMTICTTPIALLQPGLIRETASNDDLAVQLQNLGVMSYALPHCIIFILPSLCFGLKYCKQKSIKLLCLFFVVVTFFMIYLSEATMPLVIAAIAVIISLIYNVKKNVKTNVIRIVLLLFLLLPLASDSLVLGLIDYLEPVYAGTEYDPKVKELKMTIEMKELSGSDAEERQSLMSKSLSCFTNNPIGGTTNSKSLGGHNYLIDMLASLGLLGFIPLLFHLLYISKVLYMEMSDYTRIPFLIGIGSFFLMIMLKNMWGGAIFSVYAFFYCPCLLKILESKSIFNVK